MSSLANKRRLLKAQRITQLREKRCERARLQAVRAEREASERAEAAMARLARAKSIQIKARSAFFDNLGSPSAETWLIANQMREEQAHGEARIADEKCDTARNTAEAARREHEKLREKGHFLGSLISALSRDVERRVQDREEEDAGECRS